MKSADDRQRIPLGRTRRRLSYDLRLRLSLAGICVLLTTSVAAISWLQTHATAITAAFTVLAALLAALLGSVLFEQLTRPLQTLSNVVAALRQEDFSFRARGARRGDSLGDLAHEINAFAATLQTRSGAARDALALAERVMSSMRTPVLAFSQTGILRVLNPAAEAAFGLRQTAALGQPASLLGLDPVATLADGAIYSQPAVSGVSGEQRFVVRRSRFRLNGIPHELLVLFDMEAALREEERLAWQRLVRVLSHEINNSLTPITSLAGSLRTRLPAESEPAPGLGPRLAMGDLRRGLQLIEDRAHSLHRFLQAYQQLTRLPRPTPQRVPLRSLLDRVVALEHRLAVHIGEGPAPELYIDPAQIEQLLINLQRNAVEAALGIAGPQHTAEVSLRWRTGANWLSLQIVDNGPGLSDNANLFVPFYTTKPEGSGIGLALAKQIALGHGGTLTLTNRTDAQGCLAELRLPLG